MRFLRGALLEAMPNMLKRIGEIIAGNIGDDDRLQSASIKLRHYCEMMRISLMRVSLQIVISVLATDTDGIAYGRNKSISMPSGEITANGSGMSVSPGIEPAPVHRNLASSIQ